MNTFLEQIVSDNMAELETRKHRLPLAELQVTAAALTLPLPLAPALRGERVRLIAEVKKASPSRGVIRADFDAVAIAQVYACNGAAAISVLTETRYFQGSLKHLKGIREALGARRPPLLRKDFLHDPYQVYESRAYGADAILLIVAILTEQKLAEMLELSRGLGMDCLVEVHDEIELEIALKSQAGIIGINNRDLKTFTVDLATTERLCPLIPPDRTVVSESGIKERGDIERLRKCGVDGVLVGETLMAATDIASKMKEMT